jgi:hypothetical protein
MSKAYDAVDALTYELVQRLLGSEWIETERYLPISLFDYSGYMINIYSYVVSVPYYDSFRSRFWPSLAHEVGHIFVNYNVNKSGPLLELILREVTKLATSLQYRVIDKATADLITYQVVELISDTLSAYVCPASFMSAAIIIQIPFEAENAYEGELADYFKYVTHPPLDPRLAAMQNVLRLTGALDEDQDLNKYIESIRKFLEYKNMFGLTNSSYDYIEKYNDLAVDFSEETVKILPKLGVQVFSGDDWKKVKDAFFKPGAYELSPVQLLTLAWMKRLKTIKGDDRLRMQDYFRIRLTEEKAFERIINSIHKYYEREIISKLEENWFDLRVDAH